MQDFIFNLNKNKEPSGTISECAPIKYTLEVAQNYYASKVVLVYKADGSDQLVESEMMIDGFSAGYKRYSTTVKFPKEGLYWYYFRVESNDYSICVQQGEQENSVEKTENPSRCFSQLVTEKNLSTNIKPLGGVMYHIFVDRFNRVGKSEQRKGLILKNSWNDPLIDTDDYSVINRECYGGNLKGIIAKLPYLKSLNVSVIYLSPIFYAESYHKYDTADYEVVDPMIGTNAELKQLIDKAKTLGMSVILDGVFNHTGADSKYFNMFGTFTEKGAYQSFKSKYAGWYNFKEWPDSYESWWGIATLPCVNENNPQLRSYICGQNGIIEKYMNMGLGGFRLDVVDELSDEYLELICQKIYQCNKNALIVGEVWEDASTKISYDKRRHYLWGKQLNSVTNYPLRNAILSYLKTGEASEFLSCYNMIMDNYPKFVQANLMNIIGSHDTSRIQSEIEKFDSFNAKNLHKIASLIEYAFVGLPTIYYGDEIGLRNIKADISRTPYPWGSEDQEMLDWYKMLGKLRSLAPVVEGNMEVLQCTDGVIAIKRTLGNESVVVATNVGDQPFTLKLMENYKEVFAQEKHQQRQEFTIEPKGYIILQK